MFPSQGLRRIVCAALALTTVAAASATAAPIPASERLDPDARRVVSEFLSFDPPALASLPPSQARQVSSIQAAAARVAVAEGKAPLPPVARKRHMVIPTPGGPLTARVFTPRGRGPFPVLVYFPGGGFTITNLDNYEPSARALTNGAGYVVVLVNTPVAPEVKFPAQPEAAYAAYRYISANTRLVRGIPGRVAVGGESAGGNLATVTAMLARDRGGPRPIYQLLVYPDVKLDTAAESFKTEGDSVPLNTPLQAYFGANYLPTPADAANPLASPLLGDLHGLPPATVITDENDPLRSDGEAYAQKLRAAGVKVDAKRYNRVMHEFFGMGAVIAKARQAEAQAAAHLRAAAQAAAARAASRGH